MKKTFHPDSAEAMDKLQKIMIASNHSPRSVQAYSREIRFICQHYPDLSPYHWKDQHIVDYMVYLKLVHKYNRANQKYNFFKRNVHKIIFMHIFKGSLNLI